MTWWGKSTKVINMEKIIKKSSYDWQKDKKYQVITILDHKGWDAKRFKESMLEEITEKEFSRRIMLSRIECNPRDLVEFTD